ncbi:hypothetical protein [Streptomyces ramulosus]|uniref:hypothetical protein n=1 Tax=Streptomyces TaxID=1883 RepID=UPI0031E7E156
MSTKTQPTPQASHKPRRRLRVRTRSTSGQPPLRLSTLPFHQINLLPGELSLLCPTCSTWCPVSGVAAPKLVPHSNCRCRTPKDGPHSCPHNCDGSDRRVILDADPEEWGRKTAEAAASVAARRATAVRRKPKTPPTPPLNRVAPGPRTAAGAHKAYDLHRRRCAACSKRVRDQHGKPLTCADGRRLGQIYVLIQQDEPERRKAAARLEQEARRAEWERARSLPSRRAAEVARYVPAVTRADERRVRDELDATLLELQDHKTGQYRKLDRFERAALDARIGALFEVLRREAART